MDAPDPKSSHFQTGADRFQRDFATVERQNREKEMKRKWEIYNTKRM